MANTVLVDRVELEVLDPDLAARVDKEDKEVGFLKIDFKKWKEHISFPTLYLYAIVMNRPNSIQ